MANRTSPETIEKINELYLTLGVKAEVARKLGVSASTVTKYIDPEWRAKHPVAASKSNIIPVAIDLSTFAGNLASLCELSSAEWEELKELQKGIIA